jgi:predicted kinase
MAKRTAYLFIGSVDASKAVFIDNLVKNSRQKIRVICTESIKERLQQESSKEVKWPLIQRVVEDELEQAYLKAETVILNSTMGKARERKAMVKTALRYGFDEIIGMYTKSGLIQEPLEEEGFSYLQELTD